MSKRQIGIGSIIFLTFVIQVFIILFWNSEKSNYYVDELYTYGYASSYTGVGDTAQYLTIGAKWKLDEWTDISDLQNYLTVEPEEAICNQPFHKALGSMIVGRNYNGFVNLLEYLSGQDYTNNIVIIAFNILCLFLTELNMYFLFKRLRFDDLTIVLALCTYGLCGFIVGLTIYVRFYTLTLLYLWTILNLCSLIWKSTRTSKLIIYNLFLFFCMIFAINNSELTIVFCGALALLFGLGLLVNRKWKQVVCLVSVGIGILVYLATTTSYLDMLLNTSSYTASGGSAGWTTSNVMNATFGSVLSYFGWVINLLAQKYFGHYIILVLFTVLICGGIWILLGKLTDLHLGLREVVIMTVAVALTRMAYVNGHQRSICLLLLFVSILICIVIPVSQFRKQYAVSNEFKMFLIFVGAGFVYALFAALAYLNEPRYFSTSFIVIFFAIWYILDRFNKNVQGVTKKIVAVVTISLSIASCMLPFVNKNIDYLYEGDREIIAQIANYADKNVVLVVPSDPSGVDVRHIAYECITLMNSESRIYPTSVEQYTCPIQDDIFLIWSHTETDSYEIIDDYMDKGYSVNELGKTHISRIFLCTK